MHTKRLIIVIFTLCWVTFVNAQQIQYISYPLSEEHLVPALTCESATLPTVTTGSASDVKGTSATCGGSIVSDGGAIITECGVCYSTTANPTIDNDKVVATGTTIGLFTCQLAGLTLNTTYYVRAYAVSNKGVSYGEAVQIHTDECDAKPDSLTFTVNNVSFKMILVEGGTFTMGSSTSGALHCEKPLHQVALSDYYMGETEVVKNLWTVVMETGDQLEKYNTPFTLSLGLNQKDSTVFKAMVSGFNITYAECLTFIDKLNTILADQLQGMRFAIPTEAQWEYAARGGMKGNGYTYSGSNTLATVGWYGDNSMGEPMAVKKRQPNELGIYDMSGNVWELCSDWVGTYSSATQINPAGLESGLWRVVRGGCWSESASECGVARRLPFDTYMIFRMGDYGLRLALLPASDKCSSTTLPTITTDSPDMDAPIQIRGKVLSDGGADIIERGICYSTTDNPTIADTKVVAAGTAIGQFTCSVTPLQDSTTYYARAYATNSAGTSYGEVVFFTTKRKAGESGTEQGHEYVDLGLPSGLKWATCNVGASQPEAYGGFYAWGETSTKEEYSWETYAYGTSNHITKYFKTGSAETSPTLEKTDDVASQLWGGSWRMPTAADWQELIDNCIWKLEFRNGVYGYRVSSKVYGNTNSIFLPAMGRIVDGANIEEGCGGVYWSSTLHENYSDNAKLFNFSLRGMNLGYSERYFGEGVRAVCTEITQDCDSAVSGSDNGHEWVDLGLSVRWATCNIGATQPNKYGNFYAFGETSSKSDFELGSYSYYKNKAITKYNSTDGKTTLEPSDDAATVNWGGAWRIPTADEMNELLTQCIWTWDDQKNIYTIQGKNGNSIVLPSAGIGGGLVIIDPGYSGAYATSTTDCSNDSFDYNALYFISGRKHIIKLLKEYGVSIRPVNDACSQGIKVFVQTNLPTKVNKSTALCTCEVRTKDAVPIEEYGVCYSTSADPVVGSDATITATAVAGSFSCQITKLSANTTYYIRAYVRSNEGIIYGEQQMYTTESATSSTGTEQGQAWIDLGLSVKWATCNLGAASPTDCGNYYAWAETSPKSLYDWTTYKYGTYSKITKYCMDSKYGKVDHKNILDNTDDAAIATWNGKWRMPTQEEFDELITNCTITWTANYAGTGQAGIVCTSNITGYTKRSIFIPAAGYYKGSNIDNTEYVDGFRCGYYWATSLPSFGTQIETNSASCMYFGMTYQNMSGTIRSYGLTIRPVCK